MAPKAINKTKSKSIQSKPTQNVPVQKSKPPVKVKVSEGKRIGRKIGGFLGDAAETVLGKIFGLGDYTVKYNSLTGAGGPPQFTNNPNARSTVITHREYVGDITGSTNFALTSYLITPSNQQLFPWASQVASSYEEYRIHGMVFEFKSTSGMSVSSTNTALGTVIMATQYNPLDVAFNSKIEMENYEFATTNAPFENCLHPLECKPNLTVAPQLYVQQAQNTTMADSRLTNFGTFNIATVGMQAANVVGELWVSYQIELLKPRISSLLIASGTWTGTNTTGIVQNTTSGSLGTSALTVFSPLNNTDGLPLFPSPVQYVTGTSLATISNTAPSTYVSMVEEYNTTNPNGFYFPAAVYGGRTILISVTYTGTVITSVPTLTGFNTTAIGFNSGFTASSAFTATTSVAVAAFKLFTVAQNGTTQNGSIITVLSPAATTLTNVSVSITFIA